MYKAYEEIVDFIAAGSSPQSLVHFQPSKETRERVAELVRREKNANLTTEETDELNHYMQIEHLMRLAKARAYRHIAHE